MQLKESIGNFDYIIIGAGTAGCVLANRLSQDKGNNVLLIEAGGKDDYVWIHIPVGYLFALITHAPTGGFEHRPSLV